ncbi:MAG: AAA family ATPase [Betaproteobacteria bacterium]
MSTELRTLIQRLDHECRAAIERAAELCAQQTHFSVDPEHLLIELLRDKDSALNRLLTHFDVSGTHAQSQLQDVLNKLKRGNGRTPVLSEHLPRLLESAWVIASVQLGESRIDAGCLLLAALESDTLRGMLLESAPSLLQLPRQRLREQLRSLSGLASDANASSSPKPFGSTAHSEQQSARQGERQKTPALDQYTLDLTEQAKQGQLDPVIGRDEEINQLIETLLRRRQNNPILTGEAGVGKTAVVEGFAQRVVNGTVPAPLKGISVRALDIGLLQAGAGMRGEFERRLKDVILEVKAAVPPVVLFIDEAHQLIGAGGSEGVGDAANLLKPALARGELRTIAATTWSEYKQYIERDPALTRRFQVVKVAEPDTDTAIAMLAAIVPRLEAHHGVTITKAAVHDAVNLSQRYLRARQLPDKAISVLDTACARVVHSVSDGSADTSAKADKVNKVDKAEKAYKADQAESTPPNKSVQNNLSVDTEAVANVLSSWTGIPLGRMLADEQRTVLELHQRLRERVVGQDEALDCIARQIRSHRAGLDDESKPVGVFLLIGPSGVGKTETAHQLAEQLYGSCDHLITINLSEYQEPHSVAGLKGAPPGYVGYGRGGVLTEAIRRQPYSLLLLDEMEKAHPDVLELFYQVFDKGTMEDAEGTSIDFRHTLILLTSNAAQEIVVQVCKQQPDATLAQMNQALRPALLKQFPAAFLGRLMVVPYRPIADTELLRITELKLNQLAARVKRNHAAQLSWSPAVAKAIVARCHEVESGARNIDHIITQTLLPAMASEVLAAIATTKQFQQMMLSVDQQGGFVVSLKQEPLNNNASAIAATSDGTGNAGGGSAGGGSAVGGSAGGSGALGGSGTRAAAETGAIV